MSNLAVYSEMLRTNLKLLFLKHPVKSEFEHQFSKDLFLVPNQQLSNELIFYLYNIIDQNKYGSKLPWPLIDKKMENNFYTLIHNFSKEISVEYPDDKLPKVVKSFFLMPKGEKYIHFMYILSLIAMKKDLTRAGVGMFPSTIPKHDKQLRTLENLSGILDCLLKRNVETMKQYEVENREKLRLLKVERNRNHQLLLHKRKLLEKEVQNCTLPHHMKSRICNFNDTNFLNEWSALLKEKCNKLERDAKVVMDIKQNISKLARFLKKKNAESLGLSQANEQKLKDELVPDQFLNDLLIHAETVLTSQRREGPVDLSTHQPKLEQLEEKFKTLLDNMTHSSEVILTLHDKYSKETPQLEAALFAPDAMETLNTAEQEQNTVRPSLVDMLCKSTPPEMLRNLKFSELGSTSDFKNSGSYMLNDSRLGSPEIPVDTTIKGDLHSPVTIVASSMKPVCFQRNYSRSTWKQALLLSTLKKKQQQALESERENVDECLIGACNGTPSIPPGKRTSNPVKSLSALWKDSSAEMLSNLSNERPLYNDSNMSILASELNSSGLSVDHNIPQTVLSMTPPRSSVENIASSDQTQPITDVLSSENQRPLYHNRIDNGDKLIDGENEQQACATEDRATSTPPVTCQTVSQELQNFLQAVTNSNGSLMGASSVFESSSSHSFSPPDCDHIAGINMLEFSEHTQITNNTETSLAQWDDEKTLNRIVSVALSPVGIAGIPATVEVRSSTPITNNQSSQPPVNEPENLPPVSYESRIPRMKAMGALRIKKK